MLTYAEAQSYLDGFVNYERAVPDLAQRGAFDLSRIQELAVRLGNPQLKFPSLHVAGTKGKGSACAFADAILRAAGLRVGLYTSPHLLDVRERIRVDGRVIPEPDFASLLERCLPHLEEMRSRPEGTRRPTYFEVLTHLAFLYFEARQVDVAVVEVGLGGRLDATNILMPAACGITNISFDHMAILGHSLGAIAREKAGILKPGVPCVSAPQPQEAARAIEGTARACGAKCEFVGRELVLNATPYSVCDQEALLQGPSVSLRAPDGWSAQAVLGLAGMHQAENWAVAVRLAEHFFRLRAGRSLSEEAIREGSSGVVWPGRLEELRRSAGEPRIFVDGAHNEHSIETVLTECKALLPERLPRVLLFACAKDKDADAMLGCLARHAVSVVFTHSGNPRSLPPAELAARWKRMTGQEASAYPDAGAGLAEAIRLAQPKGLVLATGSLFLVGACRVLRPSSRLA